MLKSLKIERFKSVHEQRLKFGKVNLFIGPNGSGKSNILEALGVLSAALSQGIEPHTLDLRGVRLSLPHLFKSAFKNHDLPKTFNLDATFENGRYQCSIRASAKSTFLEFFSESLYDGDRRVFGRSMHGTKLHSVASDMPNFDRDSVESSRSVWSVIAPFVKISEALRQELDEFSRFAIYSPQTAIMRGLAIDNRVVEPLGLTGSGLPTAVSYILQNMSKKDVEEIFRVVWKPGWTNMITSGAFDASIVPNHVSTGGLVLYMRDKYMHADRNMLSAFDASEGTLYLIFVAALLAHEHTPNIFALDNVDGTLNPSLVRNLADHVIKVASGDMFDKNKQVFMTSHHPSSLDSFDIFNEDHSIFVCSRNKEKDRVPGSTSFSSIRPPENVTKESWNIDHRGQNLSELFLDGRIPNAL